MYISFVISIWLGYFNIFMLCPVLCYILNMQENNMYCLYSFQTQGYAHHAMFQNRFPKFCQPKVRGLFMWKYSGMLKFMSFSVWNFDSLCSPILISFFDLLWLVAVNWGMTHGWQVSFPHAPAIVQVTFTSIKLCLLPLEIDCCHTSSCSETVLQSFNVFYCQKSVHILLKPNLRILCLLKLFDFIIPDMSKVMLTK